MEKTIKTARLILRPLSPSDLETTHQYASDAENCKYMINLPNRDLTETKAFLSCAEIEWLMDKPEFYEYAICLDGKHIGAVSLTLVGDGIGEIGWILHKDYHGKGYATEAAIEIVKLARRLSLSKVIAHCDIRNVRSRLLMERLGMRFVEESPRYYADNRGSSFEMKYELIL